MLLIFDREENLQAILEQKNKNSCPYYNAIVKSVLNGEQTITFRAPFEHEDAKKIIEHGYVARKNKFGQWQLFLITEIVEVHSENTLEIEVFGESNFIELDSIILEDFFVDRKTPQITLPQLLAGTRWEAGNITGTGTHDLTVKNKSLLEALQTFKERWGVELTFRIEVAGNKISKRIIDCSDVKGAWRGKRFEYRKDLVEVKRTIDAKNIKTGLYVFGKAPMDAGAPLGTEQPPMTIEEIVWTTPTNPTNKPLGQKFIVDEAATEIWGKTLQAGSSSKKPLFAVFQDNKATTPEELINAAWEQLQTINTPLITYEARAIDLFRLLGIEPEIVELGDIAAVIDRELNNLLIQARIIELEEDLDNPENDNIVLGNFAPTFTNVTKQLEALEKQIEEVANAAPQIDLTNVLTQEDLANLATKEDLTTLATKEDLTGVVKQEDLTGYAKDTDLTGLATKDELAAKADDVDLEALATKAELQNYAPNSALTEYAKTVDLADVLREGATINPNWIDTEFEFAKDKITTGSGTVILNEGDGLLIVDNPLNPQKAIKLQAGQIALANEFDPITQTFNWRNFGTGEGWLADLVETGFLKFNRSKGGTLQLGGEVIGETAEGAPLFENGVFSVVNSQGDIVAELSGDYGGFGELRIDTLKNTQNVVFSTFNATPRVVGTEIIYYVDAYEGNDMNDGSEDFPLLTIQEAINRLPKYLDRNVFIYFNYGLLQDTEILIGGFIGTGEISILQQKRTLQFIKDWANGSTANASNHWNDIRVYTDNGTDNGLIWKLYSLEYPWRITSNSINTANLKNVGDYSISTFFDGGNVNKQGQAVPLYVQVNFENLLTVKRILVWHYYADARTYYGTKTEVSQNGSKWYTIFDSAREGEYKESSVAKTTYIDKAYLKGNITVAQCNVSVNISDLFVDASDNGQMALYARNTKDVTINNCVFFGNSENYYTVYAWKSRISIRDSEVNTAARAGIAAAYGSSAEIGNVKGSGFSIGHLAHADSIVGGYGTGLYATTQKLGENGGVINATWTPTTGAFSPVTVVQKIVTYNSTDYGTYDVGKGWWSVDKEPRQGYWGGYGLFRGLWFFGTTMRNTVVNKEIVKIRIYVTRANSSGYSSAVPIVIRTHGHATKPSGAPTINTSKNKNVSLARGESAWVDCTNEFKDLFKAGSAFGIGIYTSSYAASYYARMTVNCKVEITYKEVI